MSIKIKVSLKLVWEFLIDIISRHFLSGQTVLLTILCHALFLSYSCATLQTSATYCRCSKTLHVNHSSPPFQNWECANCASWAAPFWNILCASVGSASLKENWAVFFFLQPLDGAISQIRACVFKNTGRWPGGGGRGRRRGWRAPAGDSGAAALLIKPLNTSQVKKSW